MSKHKYINKITIIDIAKATEWKNIARAIKYHYSTDKNNYKTIFEEIKKYKKRTHEDKTEFIIVQVCGSVDDVETANDNNFYTIQTNKYSMSFRRWKTLSSIPIAYETLEHYLYADILAFFLYEITFYGDEQKTLRKILN